MLIGHAPAGFLLTSGIVFFKNQSLSACTTACLLVFGVFSGLLPDADLFYFELIDNRQHLHHTYWTHRPIFWLSVITLLCLVALILNRKLVWLYVIVFSSNIMLHLGLDSIAGNIQWLYPHSSQIYRLVNISDRYDSWVRNFVMHWTFLIELLLFATACIVYIRKRVNMRLKSVDPERLTEIKPV